MPEGLQRWHGLGHAMWLVEVAGLRLLFDPLLPAGPGEPIFGDVFTLDPPRVVDEEALRPDFILVSHRHPDHFDVRSLHRLAARDPDTVVLTSDALVEQTARQLGFRQVARVAPGHRVELAEGVQICTTPSFGEEVEWGAVVAVGATRVFNQVDTVLRSPEQATSTLRSALTELDAPADAVCDLALVRWQPALEIHAAMGWATGFPTRAYGRLLDELAALPARVLVPSAGGLRHHTAYDVMNDGVYPLDEARFLRDMARRRPDAELLGGTTGDVLVVTPDGVGREASTLAEVTARLPPPAFRPHRGVPPLVDRDPRPSSELRALIDGWLDEVLTPALGSFGERRLVLELVYADTIEHHRWTHGGPARGFDADYDLLNAIVASSLADVITGRRHWGEPLLGGELRVAQRTYDVDPQRGLASAPVPPVFLYAGLSYAESHEAWIEHQLAVLSQRPSQ